MASIKLQGDVSGELTISAPAVAGTNTLTLPASSGTLATTATAGKILQVVQGRTKTLFTTTSTSLVDIGLEATITPSSTSSKILVISNVAGIFVDATSGSFPALILLRNSTNVTGDVAAPYLAYPHLYLGSATARAGATAMNYLDSPASTSALTYKIQTFISGGATVNFQRDAQVYSTMILMEVAG
ncbi:putative tail fiber protein [Methylophilales phage MEP301]|nr:putative tail fiber protein [Methylophilales phage MEP301]